MAVTGGTVVWVGQDGPARALHPGAEVVDLGGAFVAPAFVDAHVHATATGLHLAGVDLTGVRNAAEPPAACRPAAVPGQVPAPHFFRSPKSPACPKWSATGANPTSQPLSSARTVWRVTSSSTARSARTPPR